MYRANRRSPPELKDEGSGDKQTVSPMAQVAMACVRTEAATLKAELDVMTGEADGSGRRLP